MLHIIWHVPLCTHTLPCALPPLLGQVMELLADHLACWGCHIAFPELSFLTLTQMRKFMKATPVERFRQATGHEWA